MLHAFERKFTGLCEWKLFGAVKTQKRNEAIWIFAYDEVFSANSGIYIKTLAIQNKHHDKISISIGIGPLKHPKTDKTNVNYEKFIWSLEFDNELAIRHTTGSKTSFFGDFSPNLADNLVQVTFDTTNGKLWFGLIHENKMVTKLAYDNLVNYSRKMGILRKGFGLFVMI